MTDRDLVDVRLIGGWADGKGWDAVHHSLLDSIIEITVPVFGAQDDHSGLRLRGELYGYHHKSSRTAGRPRVEYQLITVPLTGRRFDERRMLAPRRSFPLVWTNPNPFPPTVLTAHRLSVWSAGGALWATCDSCDWWGGTVPNTSTDSDVAARLADRHPEIPW